MPVQKQKAESFAFFIFSGTINQIKTEHSRQFSLKYGG